MASLVSPGVITQLIDESMYIPAVADTVPLIFIATQQNKFQSDGIQTALGTIEANTVRTVTSLRQSLQLYGNPVFLRTSTGRDLHGDTRNEVGLFTLNRFLGVGDLAYVVRADVNLNDDYISVSADWMNRTYAASAELQALSEAYLNSSNVQKGYDPTDPRYRTSITLTEIGILTRQVMLPIFTDVTFKKTIDDFYDNNATPLANSSGHQVVDVNRGIVDIALQNTGLTNDATAYKANIIIDGIKMPISILGNLAQTYSAFLVQLNGKLLSRATVVVSDGNLVITSAVTGNSSKILISDINLFSKLTDYIGLQIPIDGVSGDHELIVFENGFNQPPTATYMGFDGAVEVWRTSMLGTGAFSSEWTPHEASQMLQDLASDFKYTVEFLNQTSLGANDAAKRVTIVEALQAVVNSNQEVRSELYEYNLIVCPGFPELVDELLVLCEDVGEEVFVIGDTPYDISPEQAANWGNAPASSANSRRQDRNVAYYYPHGIGSNIDGKDVFIPASAIALRTYAYSDKEAELWFAPAGPRRGQVTGISRLGYVTGILGQPTTFLDVALNKGQRNALYQNFANINPIANLPGRGMLVLGQKTSAKIASALDRVNVARLCAHIRREARKLAFSYLFEPNDQITRDNLKVAIDGMLSNILHKRGLVDYIIVCDESNNGPDVRDRNELYVDIGLKPVKAIEFIIIPIRVVAQGAQLASSS